MMTEAGYDKDKPPGGTAAYPTEPDSSIETQRKTGVTADVKLDAFGLPVKEVQRADEGDLKDEADGHENAFVDAKEGNHLPGKQEEEHETPAAEPERPESAVKNGQEHPSIKVPDTALNGPLGSSGNDKSSEEHERPKTESTETDDVSSPIRKPSRKSGKHVSEWSHQRLAGGEDSDEEGEEVQWQPMPALQEWDIYDDDGKLVAKGNQEEDAQQVAYADLGGAGKGYTRVQDDEDAESATSMDEDTKYLFQGASTDVMDEDEGQRDALSQLQATKDMLNESQRIAYVGVTRLAMHQMVQEMENIEGTRNSKKELRTSVEDMKKWVQQMMVRLYAHMEISSDEQLMIEQLAEHGVQPADLVHPLMRNSRVKNPMAAESSPRPSSLSSPPLDGDEKQPSSKALRSRDSGLSPPPYEEIEDETLHDVRTPSQLPKTDNIDLDLRWTVLCDLFLVLIADSVYDSRSRRLLERVGAAFDISWVQICRFEKRVIDALEMQEEASKENWNEDETLEKRRKQALRRRLVVMGLATAGGGLVIGLSAGLLAPLIGAGLAAGFTTIGIGGTSGFLAGAGGVALITSSAATAGGVIGVRASNRRTGAVKTFEYRPLHNNKRLNLIVTAAGWMNGHLDDVRLPYSTVDPIMGDLYSIHWEPEMLQSMGQTINILATEALTQGLQQVLGSTILIPLMAGLQIPIILSKLSYLIDNPWTVSLARANAAGLVLADSLEARHLGKRPITFVGFSLGARLIFTCLKELAEKKAYGIVQNVYLFGSPIVANKDEYLKARSVVSGRFVNGYASNDWILGYLFRATSGGIMRVAGLAPVENIPGIENFNVTELVNGHMAYRAAMPRLLREVGWEVTSDEFTEIEDPDPDNHAMRQRELLRELDEARKEAEAKPEKRRFGLFKRGKMAEKKNWEMYDDRYKEGSPTHSTDSSPPPYNSNVLFDIDAIRRELHSEQIDVKELESTLPPMQIRSPDQKAQPETGGLGVKELTSTLPPMQLDVNERGRRSTNGTRSPLYQTHSPDLRSLSGTRTGPSSSQQSLSNGTNRAVPSPTPSPRPFMGDRGFSDFSYDYSSQVRVNELDGSPREENIRMSFDPDFERRPSPGYQSQQPPSFSEPITQKEFGAAGSDNLGPEPRTDAAKPALSGQMGALNLEHNAWADDDDEFGGEKEVKMTFA